MKSGNYRRSAYFLLVFIVLLIAACSDKKSEATSTYPYKRDGIILTLPEEWEVIEDDLHARGRRTIVVVTDVGSFATIDIYYAFFYDEPLPTLEEYSRRYLQLTMNDEEAQAMAQVDSGEVDRGDSKGVYFDVAIPEPFDLQYTLEFHPKRSVEKLAYITFNTGNEYLEAVQPYLNDFVQYTDLGH